MVSNHRQALRLAQRLHDRLKRNRTTDRPLPFPVWEWDHCRILERMLGQARDRGWQSSACNDKMNGPRSRND